MEDDDEFGDLYTDVLRPFSSSFQSQSLQDDAEPPATGEASSGQGRPMDLNINSDDEEILYGVSNSRKSNFNSAPDLNSGIAIEGKTLAGQPEAGVLPDMRRSDLDLNQQAGRSEGLAGNEISDGLELKTRVLDAGEGDKLSESALEKPNLAEDDEDDLEILVEEGDNKDDGVVKQDQDMMAKNGSVKNQVNIENFTGGSGNLESFGGQEAVIPGVSGGIENQGDANFDEEWESEDSEDDLQIVLNDNNHGPMGGDRTAGMEDEDDEDGEPLIIVADNGDVGPNHQQMIMEEQEWGGEDAGAGADGERKEPGDVAKTIGGGIATAVQPKLGYSNHVYHHPFHSQFKYVRPGAAPMPGSAPVGPAGTPGQVRPPVSMGPVAGRGRGEWRPTGTKGAPALQKGFLPGYGVAAWGGNAAGRGFGSGLDFTLPSHKTIFEVDIDSFEEKPWRLPGIDISDFFNFGLNEGSWKDYCKQLEQLRLETTMQSKIRVYESVRTDQDYDPDLPPELAAAVGNQEIPSANANLGKTEAGATDLARGRGRPPIPIGRPIPVESGSADRVPSIDTRRPRAQDYEVVIEIVCQDSAGDDEVADQRENGPSIEDHHGGDKINELKQDDTEQYHDIPRAYDCQKGESVGRRGEFSTPVDDNSISSERPGSLHLDSRGQASVYPTRAHHEDRRTKEGTRVSSPNATVVESGREKQIAYDGEEESFESGDAKHSQSPMIGGPDEEQAIEDNDAMNDDRSSGMALDATTKSDILVDDNMIHSAKKQKLSSQAEPLSPNNDDQEDSRAARSSENSRGRSGSSKDRKFHDNIDEEVLQNERSTRMSNVKRPAGDENVRRHHERQETDRHWMAVKGRGDYQRRGSDPNSSRYIHAKSDNIDRRREADVSEGAWQRGEEDMRGRRIRVEDTKKRDYGDEIGSRHRSKVRDTERSQKDDHHMRNQLNNGSWRAAFDKDTGSRHRDVEDSSKGRNVKHEDLHGKSRKEDAHMGREHAEKEESSHNYRESTNRRKRDRDDGMDQRKRDDHVRLKGDDLHYVRQKEEALFARERNERQRERDEWHRLKQSHEETLSKRERDDARAGMRSGRITEDKTWTASSRGKDEYKGASREYHSKDIGRHGEQLRKRDRVENETQHRSNEDIYARGNQLNHDERRSRHERASAHDDRAYTSDTSRAREIRQRDNPKRKKDSDSGDNVSLIPPKRNQDEHGGQMNETVRLKGKSEQEKSENEIHVNRQLSKKQREDASSDDEQSDSRRGRSKLERWTSHKERDLIITSKSSASLKGKDAYTKIGEGFSVGKLLEEPSKTMEEKQQPSTNEKYDGGTGTNNTDSKALEDKHLDTVAKLKKRSERFKLPMPSEKDAVAVKKMENELLPSAPCEVRADSEIKLERPARKRRWTGN